MAQVYSPTRGPMNGTTPVVIAAAPGAGSVIFPHESIGFFNHDSVAHTYTVLVNGVEIWKSPSVPAGTGCIMEKQTGITAADAFDLVAVVDANLTTTESTYDALGVAVTP